MSLRTYSILASVIGSAVGAWWWNRHRVSQAADRERGTVIFDSTPTASGLTSEGVI